MVVKMNMDFFFPFFKNGSPGIFLSFPYFPGWRTGGFPKYCHVLHIPHPLPHPFPARRQEDYARYEKQTHTRSKHPSISKADVCTVHYVLALKKQEEGVVEKQSFFYTLPPSFPQSTLIHFLSFSPPPS